MNHDELLAYYAAPGVFTAVSGFEDVIDQIPAGVQPAVDFVQNLLIHPGFAGAYGVKLTEQQQAGGGLHTVPAILSHAASLASGPLNAQRAPGQRVAGVCRHFATLFVAVLRHKGIPARARCGFANYFEPGKHFDHWVGEYWDTALGRWVLVDAQVDALQRDLIRPPFDTLDVPRDRFRVAGDAWQVCRRGEVDPATFGVAGTENWGIIEVFGDLMQDVAALRKVEFLPWGWYGLALEQEACADEQDLVDAIAALSSAADGAALDTLNAMSARDVRLALPGDRIDEILRAESVAT